jgi:hypothetical protein
LPFPKPFRYTVSQRLKGSRAPPEAGFANTGPQSCSPKGPKSEKSPSTPKRQGY